MYINEANKIMCDLLVDIYKLSQVEHVDKMVSTEFIWQKMNSIIWHIEDYDKDPDEYQLDADFIYNTRDEIIADLEEAYHLIENYNTIEDYEPSNY